MAVHNMLVLFTLRRDWQQHPSPKLKTNLSAVVYVPYSQEAQSVDPSCYSDEGLT
jgi:hypothetical protein